MGSGLPHLVPTNSGEHKGKKGAKGVYTYFLLKSWSFNRDPYDGLLTSTGVGISPKKTLKDKGSDVSPKKSWLFSNAILVSGRVCWLFNDRILISWFMK